MAKRTDGSTVDEGDAVAGCVNAGCMGLSCLPCFTYVLIVAGIGIALVMASIKTIALIFHH